jgi:two-component system, OmpR family, KDP operon response regulator KdpE
MANGSGTRLARKQDEPNRPPRGRLKCQPSRGNFSEASSGSVAMMPRRDRLRILVVDDDPGILRLLLATLKSHGFAVFRAKGIDTVINLFREGIPDLAILDPYALGGLSIIKQIREKDRTLPIIILSDCDKESAKVSAFDLGADDYVTKPFGIDELLARIRTALRHRLQQEGEKPLFHAGDLCVDLVRRLVTVRNNEVRFSPREYELLRLLVSHAGRVLTHEFVLQTIWGCDADIRSDIRYLRMYVRALRQKIEADPEHPTHILTVNGVGYRLREPN